MPYDKLRDECRYKRSMLLVLSFRRSGSGFRLLLLHSLLLVGVSLLQLHRLLLMLLLDLLPPGVTRVLSC